DGHDVVLTIDSVVQFIAERALSKVVDQWHAAGGSAIVMDPRDGAILAMASLPTFDPNRFRDFSPLRWRNRKVQALYDPGSPSTARRPACSDGPNAGRSSPTRACPSGRRWEQLPCRWSGPWQPSRAAACAWSRTWSSEWLMLRERSSGLLRKRRRYG